ncbi:MAG: carboxypeptidase M32 [Herpetosiphon sp.]
MQEKLNELRARMLEVNDLQSAARVLNWDQVTYMPPGGAGARGRQLALLARLRHERFTDPAVGRLLDQLRPYEESSPYDGDDASFIRVTRRDYEQAANVPSAFMETLSAHSAAAHQAWVAARPANDWKSVEPFLAKTIELSRQYSDFFPGYEHRADPMIAGSDFGMRVATLLPLFRTLREQLVPLAHMIRGQETDDSCLHQPFPGAKQIAFASDVIKRFGYDYHRGRHDLTHHPFMTQFSLNDVRITTRADDMHLSDGVFATMHEAGHALYQQGINLAYEGTRLAYGASSGVHESQSRLWENIVGRSRGFWNRFYPALQEVFPDQLKAVPLDTFYRAINRVQPSLIRVQADEVTYNLHIMIRFELGLQLLDGDLAVKDLPEAWRERYRSDLGVTPPDDRDGVMQDVHWFGGIVGGSFQGYTLGNIMSAQFFDAAVKAHPSIPAEIEAGAFGTLRGWLTQNVYRHGGKYTADEIVHRATGSALHIEPYMAYLRSKFGELYRL